MMKSIEVLDCTLRDGGYCNDCRFGHKNQKKIVSGLIDANIDIIECGFLTGNGDYDSETTRFTSADQVASIIPARRAGKIFVVLADYGKFNPDELPVCDGTSVDGIRVAFHKKDYLAGLEACKKVKEKGYKVFVQAMVSITYSDEEFLELIKHVNLLEPYAFYIVDSFGMMKSKDLIRFFYMVENNLKRNIKIGFHSHNNLQLSFANAQSLIHIQSNREIIIDASVYGMGRGAGNLNTELFVGYLNEVNATQYRIEPLLEIIDQVIDFFYKRNPWGYSLSNYLSASYNAHPNYARYLDAKNTLTVGSMNEIFKSMDAQRKLAYDKGYIEQLYVQYMTANKVSKQSAVDFKTILKDKKILLIAPGKSSATEVQKIKDAASRENYVVISINFEYTHLETNFIFVSNIKRFRELPENLHSKCIVTSNIIADDVYFKTDYKALQTSENAVKDNAGLMAIHFLIKYGAGQIDLAGFDGYQYDEQENYADIQMTLASSRAAVDAMNQGMTQVLKEYAERVDIRFITQTRNIKI